MVKINFLFWNTGTKQNCLEEISNLAEKNHVDILILAENRAPAAELLLSLNRNSTEFYPEHPRSQCEKIRVFTKFHYNFIEPIFETPRYSIRKLTSPLFSDVNLICVHLPDSMNNTLESRSEVASLLKTKIDEIEQQQKHKNTIVVGDFNMNPFDPGLVKANGLHAVMSTEIARNISRTVTNIDYEYFYNPTWSLFGDIGNKIPGSYYYKRAELVCYHWNIFDQVLIRPSLIKAFDKTSIKFLHHDGYKKIITRDGNPNKQKYSDHLPLFFTFNFDI